MKELSFLMFCIALMFGLSILFRNIFMGKDPDSSDFYIPSRAMFNIIWGSIFYIGYGMLMTSSPIAVFIFATLNGLLIFYALFLLYAQKFLLTPQKKSPAFMRRYFEKKIDNCQTNDKNITAYSYRKVMKILGLPAYTPIDSEEIAKRLNILKTLHASGKLSHDYLPQIILQIEKTLQTTEAED